MKPNFALSLSFDGIRLLLRAAGGWQRMGEVDVADPDLGQALAALREKAETRDPQGVFSKLIIPDEQIRYLSVETGPLDDAGRQDAARSALEGATPYPVDALVFDIAADGDITHIAAVARDTLAEAEAFATEHAFNPLCFVAAPADAEFLGEPFFGVTSVSEALLRDGAVLEPDGVRVVEVGEVPPPTTPEGATADVQDQDNVELPVEDANVIAPATGVDLEVEEVAAPAASIQSEAAKLPEPEPVEDLPALDDVEDNNDLASPPPEPPAELVQSDSPSTVQPVDEVDKHSRSASASEPKQLNGINEPHVAPPKPAPGTVREAAFGFASRRGTQENNAAPLGGVTREASKARPANPAPAPPKVQPTAKSPTAPVKAIVDSLHQTAPPAPAPDPIAPEAPPAPQKESADGFLSRRKAPKAVPDTTTKAARSKADASADTLEARRMTIFGARDTVQVGGKPRYLGLILMAALLVFLAGVAAWATVYLDDGIARLFQGRERTLASTLPEETQSVLANDVGATLEASDEASVDEVELASLTEAVGDGLTSEDAAVLDALRDPRPEPQEETPEALDGAALEARYAVTGIWPKAPDRFEPAVLIPLEDLYVTSIDPISPALDAVALPAALSFLTDNPMAVVTSPVAAGTNFALGTDGRVVATVEGALSPDGHLVFLGRPPQVPPATPVRFATDPTETGTLETITQVRPRARPTDLIEQNERATLGGLSRSELADLRPRLRPQALQQQEEEQQRANAPADAPPSALATAQSLRPQTRPGNFARTVARATPSQASTAAVASTPAPARVAPRTVTPSIPSSASVSREATTRNAINLRKVNLIGVYGTPSDRRALVRLSNGRYRKVQVGDRIDGGRVSAIGDSELRYQKGSRNLILKMPKG